MIYFFIEKEKRALMEYTINDILRYYDFKDMTKEAFIKLAFLWKHDPKLKNAKNLKEFIMKLHELSLIS